MSTVITCVFRKAAAAQVPMGPVTSKPSTSARKPGNTGRRAGSQAISLRIKHHHNRGERPSKRLAPRQCTKSSRKSRLAARRRRSFPSLNAFPVRARHQLAHDRTLRHPQPGTLAAWSGIPPNPAHLSGDWSNLNAKYLEVGTHPTVIRCRSKKSNVRFAPSWCAIDPSKRDYPWSVPPDQLH